MNAEQDKDHLGPKHPLSTSVQLPRLPTQRSYLSGYPLQEEVTGEKQDKNRLLPDDRFIRIKDVMAITGRSKTQIYDDPSMPRPIKLAKRESAWIEREVRDWMQARVDATRGKAA